LLPIYPLIFLFARATSSFAHEAGSMLLFLFEVPSLGT